MLQEETEELTVADTTGSVLTGILTFTIEYNASSEILVLKRVTADDLFPWEYTNVTKTIVTIESQVGVTHDKQSSEEQIGVHGVTYEHNFEFNLSTSELDQTHLFLAVWQHEESGDESLIGECTVAMDTAEITSAPGKSLVMSRKLFKQLVSGKRRKGYTMHYVNFRNKVRNIGGEGLGGGDYYFTLVSW
jgi:hypothetical protein